MLGFRGLGFEDLVFRVSEFFWFRVLGLGLWGLGLRDGSWDFLKT